MDLDLILEVVYIVGYIVGTIGGIGLIAYNRWLNIGETDNGRMIGCLVGVALIFPYAHHLLSREATPVWIEALLYSIGGGYLVWQRWASYESARTRIIFATVGYFTLLVPLRLVVNLFLIWRAGL